MVDGVERYLLEISAPAVMQLDYNCFPLVLLTLDVLVVIAACHSRLGLVF